MAIYLVTFALSCGMFKIASAQKRKGSFLFFSAIGILLPCLLAAFRAETIGTDVRVYVKPLYEAAKDAAGLGDYFSRSWWAEWRYKYVSDFEIGFSLGVYCITKVFGSLSAVLFFISMAILVPVYAALRYHRDKLQVWFGMLVFYLVHYNTSLNMMRQWIALALLLYALRYLEEQRPGRYFGMVLCAMLFHTSAVIGGAVYFLCQYVNRESRIKLQLGPKRYSSREYRVVFIALAGMAGLLMLELAIWLLNALGLEKYLYYVSGSVHFMPNQIILRLPVLLLFLWNYPRTKREPMTPFWITMLVIELLVSQLLSVTPQSGRIGVFFSEYWILSIPVSLAAVPEKYNRRRLAYGIFTAYLLFYWWFYFAHGGTNETVPYLFGF